MRVSRRMRWLWLRTADRVWLSCNDVVAFFASGGRLWMWTIMRSAAIEYSEEYEQLDDEANGRPLLPPRPNVDDVPWC